MDSDPDPKDALTSPHLPERALPSDTSHGSDGSVDEVISPANKVARTQNIADDGDQGPADVALSADLRGGPAGDGNMVGAVSVGTADFLGDNDLLDGCRNLDYSSSGRTSSIGVQ